MIMGVVLVSLLMVNGHSQKLQNIFRLSIQPQVHFNDALHVFTWSLLAILMQLLIQQINSIDLFIIQAWVKSLALIRKGFFQT